MPNFIAEVVGKDSHEDGTIVTVRMTGFGAADGPMMTRAKARAIASSRFGRDQAEETRVTNQKGFFGGYEDVEEKIFADKSEDLFKGPASGVRDRLKAFRSEGLFAEVKDYKTLKTERVLSDKKLEDTFGNMSSVVSTYEYDILITTRYALG